MQKNFQMWALAAIELLYCFLDMKALRLLPSSLIVIGLRQDKTSISSSLSLTGD